MKKFAWKYDLFFNICSSKTLSTANAVISLKKSHAIKKSCRNSAKTSSANKVAQIFVKEMNIFRTHFDVNCCMFSIWILLMNFCEWKFLFFGLFVFCENAKRRFFHILCLPLNNIRTEISAGGHSIWCTLDVCRRWFHYGVNNSVNVNELQLLYLSRTWAFWFECRIYSQSNDVNKWMRLSMETNGKTRVARTSKTFLFDDLNKSEKAEQRRSESDNLSNERKLFRVWRQNALPSVSAVARK